MARSAGFAVENNFSRGLITEATGLNFPENAVTEADNCVFDKIGKVSRRLGFDLELDYVRQNHTGGAGAFSEFLWRTVDNNGSRQFVVIQRGNALSFYEVSDEDSLSSQKKAFSINLNSYDIAGNPGTETQLCQYSSGDGRLIVAHPFCNPLLVEYVEATDTITVETIDVRIRDFEGVDDGLDFDFRPTTLSATHRYNLLNQGWYADAQRQGTDNISPVQVLDYWDSLRSDFPANSDVWWYFTTSGVSGNQGGPASSLDQFNPGLAETNKDLYGNSPAAKGHYIFSAFDIKRTDIVPSLSNSFNSNSSYWRPSCTTFFQGRAWYSGVDYAPFNNKIYFSKIIERKEDYGICYQANDPTSRQISDLLPSDGGVIVINEADRITQLFSAGGNLFVFANNGTWLITGPDQSGFNADSYVVRRLSSIGCEAPQSLVDVDGNPIWWNYDGVYTVQPNELGNVFQVVSLTQQSIQSFFEDIPRTEIQFVKGAYNPVDKIVEWIYKSTQPVNFDDHFKYDKAIVLDLQGQSWSPKTVAQEYSGTVYCYIQGILFVFGRASVNTPQDVTTSAGEVVTTLALETIEATQVNVGIVASTFKYPVAVRPTSLTEGISFGEYYRTTYEDLNSLGAGIDYSSYFTSGYKIRGESHKYQQNHYLTITSETETDSGFLVSGRWEYTINSDDNKWSTRQQGYKPSINRSYTQRKLKIRGKGKVLQYRVDSQAGKPFNIVGWGTFDSVSNAV